MLGTQPTSCGLTWNITCWIDWKPNSKCNEIRFWIPFKSILRFHCLIEFLLLFIFLKFCAGDIMSFQELCNSGLATDVYGTVLMENQTIRDLVTIYIYYLTEKVNEQSLDLTWGFSVMNVFPHNCGFCFKRIAKISA